MTEKTILHQLHAIAQANGLTAAAWARAADMKKQNLNAMLRGHREPRESTLIRLAEAAGATITIKNANSMRPQSNSKALATVQQYCEHLPVRGEGEILIPDYGVLGANTGLDLLYGKRHTTAFINPSSYAHYAFEVYRGNRAAIGIPEHYELVPGFLASGQKVFVLYAENITFPQEKGGGFRSINIRDLP